MVHALKRMRIDAGRIASAVASQAQQEVLKRKEPTGSGKHSPMVLVDGNGGEDDKANLKALAKKMRDEERRKRMVESLKNQLRQYKSQYASISEGFDIAPCDGFD